MIKYKNNFSELIRFRRLVYDSQKFQKNEVNSILKWRKKLLKKSKIKTKLTNINDCKDWHFDKNKNLVHKSGQFFKVQGVKIFGAKSREVASWSQPILNQKHGGVLAFIARYIKKRGIEFLIECKTEPGDDSDLKISPSFQATQSNMNRAHGGKLPKFYDIVIKLKGSRLIYSTSHNEEGARFWKKSNLNVIVQIKNPYDKRIKGENYKWVNFGQLKQLALKNNIVNSFVKTILFMI